jgi:hypothetical protein
MFQRFYSVTNQLAIGPMKMAIKTLNFICLKGVKDAKPEIKLRLQDRLYGRG